MGASSFPKDFRNLEYPPHGPAAMASNNGLEQPPNGSVLASNSSTFCTCVINSVDTQRFSSMDLVLESRTEKGLPLGSAFPKEGK